MATRNSIQSDDFNRSDGALGSNWDSMHPYYNYARILSAKAQAYYGSDDAVMRWIGSGTFTSDQYALAKIGGFSGATADAAGVLARVGTGIDTSRAYYGYFVTFDDNPGNAVLTKLVRCVAGSTTILDSTDIAWANDDLIEIEVEGTGTATVVRGYRNGSQQVSYSDNGGSALDSGQPGFILTKNGATLDDWNAGSLTTGGGGGTPKTIRRTLMGVG